MRLEGGACALNLIRAQANRGRAVAQFAPPELRPLRTMIERAAGRAKLTAPIHQPLERRLNFARPVRSAVGHCAT